MTRFEHRRAWLRIAATLPLTVAIGARAAQTPAPDSPGSPDSPEARLAQLEQSAGGRLGVFALNTADGTQIGHRADERFPFCSTFKVILIGAILARSAQAAGLMQQRIHYTAGEVVHYSAVTAEHVSDGMTVAELCAAAIQRSDNTAANLLIRLLGGPDAVTAYARSLGNPVFRLDRLETALNDAVPGDPRDTASPAAMARSLQALTLGEALPLAQRTQLLDWLRGNRMGAQRIRAALPAGWTSGDKTGTGDYGTANDLGLIWPPSRAPILLGIYHTQAQQDAKARDDVIAAAARIVVGAMS
ncbi:MAG: class A beta-lactamase [Pseudomonadota bacterium]|jgi:beta-lactamase class A|uniref:class A beta-lactamase n=1 Tax=Burkholderiaceae TaxID=119060 RepID=UPI0010F7144B|nr:class A beta-lactamase [Burkholderia sp. 4M9327F10]